MPRSCLQPWAQEWRRKTIQVSKQQQFGVSNVLFYFWLESDWLFMVFSGKLITLEAMSGLSKVLLHLDKNNVHLLVVYIFMKIRPFLESVS